MDWECWTGPDVLRAQRKLRRDVRVGGGEWIRLDEMFDNQMDGTGRYIFLFNIVGE